MIGRGSSGALHGRLRETFWQTGQLLQNWVTSSFFAWHIDITVQNALSALSSTLTHKRHIFLISLVKSFKVFEIKISLQTTSEVGEDLFLSFVISCLHIGKKKLKWKYLHISYSLTLYLNMNFCILQISLFCIYKIYWSQTTEGSPKIPWHSSTCNSQSCSSWAGIMLIVNNHACVPCLHLIGILYHAHI